MATTHRAPRRCQRIEKKNSRDKHLQEKYHVGLRLTLTDIGTVFSNLKCSRYPNKYAQKIGIEEILAVYTYSIDNGDLVP